MKLDTIKKLVECDETHEYIASLWQTDIFRRSHAEHGFVHGVVNKFSTMPSFFFKASDENLEKAHFATWWRGIQIRDYDNPYIHDLYLLHELYHAGDMIFARGLSHDMFKRKMQDNELGASVCSEIEAYFRLPDLRDKTFSQEIYADRFLNDPIIQERFKKDSDRLIRELKLYRQNVMMSDFPSDHKDRSQFWIKQFSYQNEAWANIWVHRFNDVETALVKMRHLVDDGKKQEALDKHLEWLLSAERCQNNIPFAVEATAFAGVYWANKAAFEREQSKNLQVSFSQEADCKPT
jgi:hypothetical protein